jgi:hypothetical protein
MCTDASDGAIPLGSRCRPDRAGGVFCGLMERTLRSIRVTGLIWADLGRVALRMPPPFMGRRLPGTAWYRLIDMVFCRLHRPAKRRRHHPCEQAALIAGRPPVG